MTKITPASTAMALDYDVAMEVAAHEALVRQTYKDSKGVLTWCVGMTNATGHRVERYIGKPANLQTCMDVYVWALDNYAAGVREVFKGHNLTKAQFAAALSFHWNTGAIKRATWVTHFKAGDMAAAKKAFMNWVTPPEVKLRRQKERDLFFDGRWSNDGTMVEYTRLRANMQPDFGSGRRINVQQELQAAFASRPRPIVDQIPDPNSEPAAPTLSPDKDKLPAPIPAPVVVEKPVVADPEELSTPPGKSKTVWTWALAGVGSVISATGEFMGGLDWRVQLAITGATVGFAIYGIKRRADLFKAVKQLQREFG